MSYEFIVRIFKNLCFPPWGVGRVLSKAAFKRVVDAIRESELQHRAELVLAVEGSLGLGAFIGEKPLRDRAIECFARMHVWDTEENNGVMLYVLLSERRGEIVPDRALGREIHRTEWLKLSDAFNRDLKTGDVCQAIVRCIDRLTPELSRLFPEDGGPNQLSDEPIVV